MPTSMITKRQRRRTLRLHPETGLSVRERSRALGVAKATVGAIISMARAAGVDWAVAQTFGDEELRRPLASGSAPKSEHYPGQPFTW